MGKYRRKPVDVEAFQWDGTEANAVGILVTLKLTGAKVVAKKSHIQFDVHADIPSPRPFDWVGRDSNGDVFVCPADTFPYRYEPL